MLRGDVDGFYQKLHRRWPEPPHGPIPALDHVRAIAEYYRGLDLTERELLLAWAKKEQSGIGMIPATLSGIPLLGLLFVPLIQAAIRDLPHWVWLSLWAVGAIGFVTGVYVHQRQHAYAALHIEILQRLCGERSNNPGP